MDEVVFTFNRIVLADLPDKLEACARVQSSEPLRKKLVACAGVFRNWLKGNAAEIRCTRSIDSWKWLVDAVREAKAHTFGTALERRIHTWEIERETAAEKADEAKRTQAAMAEFREANVEPVDPHIAADDRDRLTGQNAVILERLRQGPATNVELSELCLRYSARAHDLRQAGHNIKSQRIEGGLWKFWLDTEGVQGGAA